MKSPQKRRQRKEKEGKRRRKKEKERERERKKERKKERKRGAKITSDHARYSHIIITTRKVSMYCGRSKKQWKRKFEFFVISWLLASPLSFSLFLSFSLSLFPSCSFSLSFLFLSLYMCVLTQTKERNEQGDKKNSSTKLSHKDSVDYIAKSKSQFFFFLVFLSLSLFFSVSLFTFFSSFFPFTLSFPLSLFLSLLRVCNIVLEGRRFPFANV